MISPHYRDVRGKENDFHIDDRPVGYLAQGAAQQ
jgi:hypothetical protein